MPPLDGDLIEHEGVGVDFRPHPLTTEGRRTIVVPSGLTLEDAFAHRIPPGAPAVALVNGVSFPQEMWPHVLLRETDIVVVRVAVGRGFNPLAAILTIAALVAAPYLAGFVLGTTAALAATTLAGQVLTAVIGIGGVLAVNALFPPRLPTPPALKGAGQAAEALQPERRVEPRQTLRPASTVARHPPHIPRFGGTGIHRVRQ